MAKRATYRGKRPSTQVLRIHILIDIKDGMSKNVLFWSIVMPKMSNSYSKYAGTVSHTEPDI